MHLSIDLFFLPIKQLVYIYIYSVCVCACGGIMLNVFANGQRDRSSISGRVLPKIQKVVLDAFLLNTLNYNVQIKC